MVIVIVLRLIEGEIGGGVAFIVAVVVDTVVGAAGPTDISVGCAAGPAGRDLVPSYLMHGI